MPPLHIAIAIILRDQRILICRRRSDQPLGGYWEFPGGKVQPGEQLSDAVVREVMEEVGLVVQPIEALSAIEHAYAQFSVQLHAFLCTCDASEAQAMEGQELRWVSVADLPSYSFPPANASLLRWIAERIGGGISDRNQEA